MFWGRFKPNQLPIGIDVGEHSVRLLQIGRRGASLRVIAAASAELSSGPAADTTHYHQAVTDAIKSSLDRGGFSGNLAVSTLPSSAVQCKNLRLPLMPADELHSAVEWEATERFRMGDGQCAVQFLEAGTVQQGDEQRQELIMLAARKSYITAHVKSLGQAGLKLQAIDSTPTALTRLLALQASTAGADSFRVAVHLGSSDTKILVVDSGRIRFYKVIEIGVRHLDSVISGKLNLPIDQARDLHAEIGIGETDAETLVKVRGALAPTLGELGREISLCLRYYGVTFRGPRPNRGTMLGEGSSDWLCRMLSESCGITLEPKNPLEGIDFSEVDTQPGVAPASSWGVAAGLSLRPYKIHTNHEIKTVEGVAA
ncbi:MAG: pilus assembly protein PilM [Planctomycetota bacterium]